jgi:hypothetical protein
MIGHPEHVEVLRRQIEKVREAFPGRHLIVQLLPAGQFSIAPREPGTQRITLQRVSQGRVVRAEVHDDLAALLRAYGHYLRPRGV